MPHMHWLCDPGILVGSSHNVVSKTTLVTSTVLVLSTSPAPSRSSKYTLPQHNCQFCSRKRPPSTRPASVQLHGCSINQIADSICPTHHDSCSHLFSSSKSGAWVNTCRSPTSLASSIRGSTCLKLQALHGLNLSCRGLRSGGKHAVVGCCHPAAKIHAAGRRVCYGS